MTREEQIERAWLGRAIQSYHHNFQVKDWGRL